MNIERVYAALQRDTHFTDRQMYREFPEFTRLYSNVVFEERLRQLYNNARAVRVKVKARMEAVYDRESGVSREASNDAGTG